MHKYSVTAVSRDFPVTPVGRVLKFALYIHHYKSLPRNILGLFLKNKMAIIGISLSVMKECRDFPVTPLEQKVLLLQLSNLQDMCIITFKSLPGNILALILKNKIVTGISLMAIEQFYTF